jgi:hypothetical protein
LRIGAPDQAPGETPTSNALDGSIRAALVICRDEGQYEFIRHGRIKGWGRNGGAGGGTILGYGNVGSNLGKRRLCGKRK